MKQTTFASLAYAHTGKRTRRERFLAQMDAVIPWDRLVALIAPHYPKPTATCGGRVPLALQTKVRVYCLQQFYDLSDPGAEQALYDAEAMRRFARIELGDDTVPDESTILQFRRLLERHGLTGAISEAIGEHLAAHGLMMRQGTVVDASLIHAPSSTKTRARKRDPEMGQTKTGHQGFFGMQAHIGVDLASALVHTVVGTTAKVADITPLPALVHGHEQVMLGDAGYHRTDRTLDSLSVDEAHGNRQLAALRAQVEHPFRVLKRPLGFTKVRYRGLAKHTARLHVLFALANLYLARRRLLAAPG